MSLHRMKSMRTLSLAKHAIPAVLILLGSSTTALAADDSGSAESGKTPAAPAEAAPSSQTPAQAATAKVEQAEAPPPAPDPEAISQIGVQRLPPPAFLDADNRGLRHGSLAMGFHGLQWPYMPSAGGPRFVLGLSGWGWVDASYAKFKPWGDNNNISSNRIAYWIQQGRFVFRATPTYSLGDGWFVQAQAELVATEDQTIQRQQTGGADTDDLWLRLGQWKKWDVTVGRFEGWEVFHLGMGLDLNTFERGGAYGPGDTYNPVFYGVTDNQYRPQGALGNAAVHVYPTKYLRFELLGAAGSDSSGKPTTAVRPVAIFDLGWVKLKAGTEYQTAGSQSPDTDKTSITRRGVGGAVQFVFQPHIEFGINAAQGTVESVDNKGNTQPKANVTRTSFGAFANVSNGSIKHPLMFGVGSVYTHYVDQNNFLSPQVDDYWQVQNFAAIQYVALNQLYIKLVAGYARGHWQTNDPLTYDDEVYSLRVRFSTYF
jgi:hypothetical protein